MSHTKVIIFIKQKQKVNTYVTRVNIANNVLFTKTSNVWYFWLARSVSFLINNLEMSEILFYAYEMRKRFLGQPIR